MQYVLLVNEAFVHWYIGKNVEKRFLSDSKFVLSLQFKILFQDSNDQRPADQNEELSSFGLERSCRVDASFLQQIKVLKALSSGSIELLTFFNRIRELETIQQEFSSSVGTGNVLVFEIIQNECFEWALERIGPKNKSSNVAWTVYIDSCQSWRRSARCTVV